MPIPYRNHQLHRILSGHTVGVSSPALAIRVRDPSLRRGQRFQILLGSSLKNTTLPKHLIESATKDPLVRSHLSNHHRRSRHMPILMLS